MFQVENMFRKEREVYEEQLYKAKYEAQYMQNKISQLKEEIEMQEN